MTVEYVGPFETWQVVIDGWEVPLLTANPQAGGKVFIGLDRRMPESFGKRRAIGVILDALGETP